MLGVLLPASTSASRSVVCGGSENFATEPDVLASGAQSCASGDRPASRSAGVTLPGVHVRFKLS